MGDVQRWPDRVDANLWASEREMFGDPDQGMPTITGRSQELYVQAVDFMRRGDVTKAGEAFQEAADQGHPGAWREIAAAAFHDLPGQMKIITAATFDRAASQGDGRGMVR